MPDEDRLALVADVAGSYLRQNAVGVDQIAKVVANVSKALDAAARELAGESAVASAPAPADKPTPAVPVKRSVQRDYIICLEDGARVRTLKRHLMAAHGLTPDQYRAKWSLPRDYPVTAPEYSERRSTMAKTLGLGTKRAAKKGRKRGKKQAAAE
jgi:predicted transcriptional regulator